MGDVCQRKVWVGLGGGVRLSWTILGLGTTLLLG